MSVPILVPWDMYLGRVVVWTECLNAGVRRAVLLPRLDTIFGPAEEDPARETPREELDWRLLSPTEADWTQYRALVEKQATRAGLRILAQRVENVAQWIGGRQVAVPQYHLWLFRHEDVGRAIQALYDEADPARRRAQWQWLLEWTDPSPRSTETGNP
ncbi:MAG TPA: hypothetical protein VK929_16190 [Longimicrobiales bacterium]|nr:hypothetical protein [Longimicrobiales bacterium]